MKKLLITCLLIAFLYPICFADDFSGYAAVAAKRRGAGALSCTTADDTSQFAPTTQTATGASNIAWVSDKITFATTTRITEYRVKVSYESGADTGAGRCVLVNNNAVPEPDEPDETSEVADSDVSVNASVFDDYTAKSQEIFTLASPIQVAAGTYWLVCQETGGAELRWWYATSTGDTAAYSSNSGSSWSALSNNAYDMEIWGCSE